jgi:hypothetical protein
MGGLYMGRMGFLSVFDLAAHSFRVSNYDEPAAWRERAGVELLDLDHAVLIIRPGVPEERRAA